ncbi:MAG: hypothetical protein KAH01_06240, partial [Caldisericia bacterium]|nr:hypothetical protein [Caldisericia bacterium]
EEKGHVEGSVKVLRNQIFGIRYKFDSFEEASIYLQEKCKELNLKSQIEEEKKVLLPYKPMLELADIRQVKVNSYSFARMENRFYSVPDYLVGKTITAKIYAQHIDFYASNNFVCSHDHAEDGEKYNVKIQHYLSTLRKKPGAIRHSVALKSIPGLKSVFEVYYTDKPKAFIDIISKNKDDSIENIIHILRQKGKEQPTLIKKTKVVTYTLNQLKQYNTFLNEEIKS